MANVKIDRTPFKEAIDFFTSKTPLPSGAHTDLLHEMHNKAFVIAGVTKTELLTDVQELLTDAMQKGIPLEQFKKQLGKTIEGRWLPVTKTGVPNSGGRARTIYKTNMRTAHAAGRYKQLQEVKKLLPYWRYRHGDSLKPRPEHLAWDGLVLKVDDPWWDTHFPPNGWGCTCYVEPIGETEYQETADSEKTKLVDSVERVPFGDRVIDVPAGVDPGWGYAPGAGGNQGLLNALAQGHPEIAAEAWTEIGQTAVKEETEAFKTWVNAMLTTRRVSSEARVVGFMNPDLLKWVKNRGLKPASAALEIRGEQLLHLRAGRKIADGTAVAINDIKNLPKILEKPQSILFDKNKKNLLYVFEAEGDERHGKFVVTVGIKDKVMNNKRRVVRMLNRIDSAGLVEKRVLTDTNLYEIVTGAL